MPNFYFAIIFLKPNEIKDFLVPVGGTRIQNFCELVRYWYRNISLEEKHARNSDGFHFLFLAGVLSNVVLSYGAARRKKPMEPTSS